VGGPNKPALRSTWNTQQPEGNDPKPPSPERPPALDQSVGESRIRPGLVGARSIGPRGGPPMHACMSIPLVADPQQSPPTTDRLLALNIPRLGGRPPDHEARKRPSPRRGRPHGSAGVIRDRRSSFPHARRGLGSRAPCRPSPSAGRPPLWLGGRAPRPSSRTPQDGEARSTRYTSCMEPTDSRRPMATAGDGESRRRGRIDRRWLRGRGGLRVRAVAGAGR
jgi:hypothetical protein